MNTIPPIQALPEETYDIELEHSLLHIQSLECSFLAPPQLYSIEPELVACDVHPDYLSTQFAKGSRYPAEETQHHYAHILACMAENQLAPPPWALAEQNYLRKYFTTASVRWTKSSGP